MLIKAVKYLALIMCIIILLCVTFTALVFYSNIGFFKSLREIYVETAMTTMNHQYLAKMFISKKEIDRIMGKSAVYEQQQDKTDIKVIKLAVTAAENDMESAGNKKNYETEENNGIEAVDISETTFKGKLLIIKDPSRIKLSVSRNILKCGEKLEDLISDENATGGINASGFCDPEGKGKGGVPVGIVIKDGKTVYDQNLAKYPIIGFNNENILVLGRYTKNEIKSLNLRDAVSFTPFLIVNGQPQIKDSDGGWGIQPRTSIGQTKDGKVLMLVIDGRQISSIGASLKKVQDIMLEHGAYNAANLDGGSSTVMYYQGQMLNKPCSIYGERLLPDAFVIKE